MCVLRKLFILPLRFALDGLRVRQHATRAAKGTLLTAREPVVIVHHAPEIVHKAAVAAQKPTQRLHVLQLPARIRSRHR